MTDHSLIPTTLNAWTYEAVRTLCEIGRTESDRHDFKADFQPVDQTTKVVCAFANTYGGFLIYGVRETDTRHFEIAGVERDREMYGRLLAKVKADPEITIPQPRLLEIPEMARVLYVFEIPQSLRRPHLPSQVDKRTFWKRSGSDCLQMTLEEIRYQMNSYDEKREKLTLLAIDLHHKFESLRAEATLDNGEYNGHIFSFDVIDRIVVEAFAFLKNHLSIIAALEQIRRELMTLNASKQVVLQRLSISDHPQDKVNFINRHRAAVSRSLGTIQGPMNLVERALKENFEIENPYKVAAGTA